MSCQIKTIFCVNHLSGFIAHFRQFFCIIDQEVGWGREVGREGAFIYTISSHSPSPIQGKLCLNPQIHIFRNKKVIGCINDGISWKFVFGSYDLQFIPGSLFNQSCCNRAPGQKENKYLGSIISNAWSASKNINSQFIESFCIILYCFPLSHRHILTFQNKYTELAKGSLLFFFWVWHILTIFFLLDFFLFFSFLSK